MKLFPAYPSPSQIKPHHVPLATTRLSTLASEQTWDLTTTRLLPYVNGLHSVSDIARLADADLRLVRRSIMHLLYYGFLLLLDIFTAGAVYAPTPEIGVIFTDEEMQEECIRYTTVEQDMFDEESGRRGLKKDEVCRLYGAIRHGLTVRAWCMENVELLQGVDVRRFITFGVIKGFLYRVHKYAVAVTPGTNGNATGSTTPVGMPNGEDVVVPAIPPTTTMRTNTANGNGATIVRTNTAGGNGAISQLAKEGEEGAESPTPTGIAKTEVPIADFLDGLHSFDEICAVLEANEKTVLERMTDEGEVQLIYR